VVFQTGPWKPDYHAVVQKADIVLPWDRDVVEQA
jgi:hypothetical protein